MKEKTSSEELTSLCIDISDFEMILKWYQNHAKYPSKYHNSYTWSEPINLNYEKNPDCSSIDSEREFDWSDPIDLERDEEVGYLNIECYIFLKRQRESFLEAIICFQ